MLVRENKDIDEMFEEKLEDALTVKGYSLLQLQKDSLPKLPVQYGWRN